VAASANELAALSASLQKLAGERVEEILSSSRRKESKPREDSIDDFQQRHQEISEHIQPEHEESKEEMLDLPPLPELMNTSESSENLKESQADTKGPNDK